LRRAGVRVGGLVVWAVLGWSIALAAQVPGDDPFRHDLHEGLFPLCAGCHAEADPRGLDARMYPEPSLCAGCHDGVTEEVVDWSGPAVEASNLRYSYSAHDGQVRAAGEAPLACAGCHSQSADAAWQLVRLEAEGCAQCHETQPHLTGAECSSCHIPLSETEYSAAQVEAIPSPPAHEGTAFLLDGHGEVAQSASFDSCITCHTRERCLSCHVVQTELITQVPPTPARMVVPRLGAEYPEPESHQAPQFSSSHPVNGEFVRSECGSCHTQNDCLTCHVSVPSSPILSLPLFEQGRAPGVRLARVAPETHAQPDFGMDHAGLALNERTACVTCHTEETCTACHAGPTAGALHAGPTAGSFHPAAYVARHAAEAFSATMECSNCHSTAVFCRECHASSGLGSSGRLGSGYHDAEPLWLLRHGQAARQTLESCAGCHQQRDCVQCHSSTGAFRVNPHGSGFDADRAWQRSAPTCRACHIGDPRRSPN